MNLHVSPQRATDALLAQSNLRLRIGEHVVDVGALRLVTRPECPRLTSKAVAVLIELVRHVGATVTREELLDRVWTGRFTTPDVLTQAIKELRRAFVDDSKPSRYIETIPKVGYRLIAPVLVLDGPASGIFIESPPAASLAIDPDPAEAEASAPSPSVPTASSPVPSPALQAPPAHVPPRARGTRRWLVAAALAVAAIAIGLVLAGRSPRTPSAQADLWRVTDSRALTSDPGSEYRPHLSPDATRVAFTVFDPDSGHERLVVRSVEPSQRVHLTEGTGAIEGVPVWSPDGQRIVFERLAPNYCEMFLISSVGGSEREIGTCQDFNSNYYDWTPDSRSLISSEAFASENGEFRLFTLDLDTGVKHPLVYPHAQGDQDIEARYSPDGRWLAFRRGFAPYSDLFVMPADGSGTPRQITRISARIRGYTWMADNRTLVYSSDYKGPSALYAVDVDSGRTQALGISPAGYPDAGRTGDSVVYEITRTQDKLTLLSIGADGSTAKPRVLAPSTGSDFRPLLSPDGERAVFASDRSGNVQLWLYDMRSAATTQLTPDSSGKPVFFARWSPDSRRVIAVQRNEAQRELVEIDLATHRQRLLSKSDDKIMFGDYAFADDTYLFAIRNSDKDTQLIEVAHPGTPQETRTRLLSGISAVQVDQSAKAIYYTSNEEKGLFRYDAATGRPTLVTAKVAGGNSNGWRIVDGRVWYIADLGIRTANMREFDPASGADRIVARMSVLMQDLGFSVLPSHDAILFAPVDVEDTDIGIFRLQRAPAS